MIIARFHRQSGEMLLAACDEELFGKCLESDELKLDMGSSFFDGEKVTDEEFCGMLAQATSANLVGQRAIALAIEQGYVHSDAVLIVCGVPHAIFFCF